MTKQRVKKLITLAVVFLVVLIILLLFRAYLVDRMDNYPLYASKQVAATPIIGIKSNVTSAEVNCGDPEIKGSKKIAIINMEIQRDRESYSYKMRYIQFESKKAAENYVAQCIDDPNIEREWVNKYVFEFPKYEDEDEVEHIVKASFSSVIPIYKMYVLVDYSDVKKFINELKED